MDWAARLMNVILYTLVHRIEEFSKDVHEKARASEAGVCSGNITKDYMK